MGSVLVVSGNTGLARALERLGLDIHERRTTFAWRGETGVPAAVLLDLRDPDHAAAALEHVRSVAPDVPVLVVGGGGKQWRAIGKHDGVRLIRGVWSPDALAAVLGELAPSTAQVAANARHAPQPPPTAELPSAAAEMRGGGVRAAVTAPVLGGTFGRLELRPPPHVSNGQAAGLREPDDLVDQVEPPATVDVEASPLLAPDEVDTEGHGLPATATKPAPVAWERRDDGTPVWPRSSPPRGLFGRRKPRRRQLDVTEQVEDKAAEEVLTAAAADAPIELGAGLAAPSVDDPSQPVGEQALAERPDQRTERTRRAAERDARRVEARARRAEREAARRAAEEEAARVAAEREAARLAAEAELTRLAAQEEAARVAAEDEARRAEERARFEVEKAARLAAEQEVARLAAEAEATRAAAEMEAARRAAQEVEAARLAAEQAARIATEQEARRAEERARFEAEDAARLAAEEEAARLAAEAEAARLAAEEEAARTAAQQEAARVAAEEEARRAEERARFEAEEAARRAAEQEVARLAAEAEAALLAAKEVAARLAAEAEAARLAVEAEKAARLAAEEEAARLVAERAAARVVAEKEARRVAELARGEAAREAARLAAEWEAARLAAEEEAARLAAEAEAARVAAEEEAARLAAEAEAERVAAEHETVPSEVRDLRDFSHAWPDFAPYPQLRLEPAWPEPPVDTARTAPESAEVAPKPARRPMTEWASQLEVQQDDRPEPAVAERDMTLAEWLSAGHAAEPVDSVIDLTALERRHAVDTRPTVRQRDLVDTPRSLMARMSALLRGKRPQLVPVEAPAPVEEPLTPELTSEQAIADGLASLTPLPPVLMPPPPSPPELSETAEVTLATTPPSLAAALAAVPSEEQRVAALRSVMQHKDSLLPLNQVSRAVLDEALSVCAAEAGALLVAEDGAWSVVAGVALRPREERLLLGPEHWAVSSAIGRGLAILVEHSDIVRQRIAGMPLASWEHLLVAPVGSGRALLILARSTAPFAEEDISRIAAVDPEASVLLDEALQVRDLARALKGFS